MGLISSADLPIIGYSLPIWLVHNTPTLPGPTTIYPRYNDSTANTFTFTSSGDYAPAAAIGGGNNAYADFAFQVYPGNGGWYNDNKTLLRIINLGGLSDSRSMIVIRGLCLIMHAKTGIS